MLYESKADGSLAAHATQSRLRLQGGHVRHDHSVAKALNRGGDIPEGDQADFLEDHGFVIKTQAIAGIIDPHASYTLEYIDMILSLKANKWKVLFVPSARLEFRIAEFSWRDVPYFMYKRSEATCHGTRDYLAAKWRAKFPNTGFWTYIKYTIVESHEYPASEISVLPWKQQASLFLGFFQMAGFNRYAVGGRTRTYVDLLMELDSGAYEAKQAGYFSSDSVALDGVATRELKRKAWAPGDLKPVPNASGAEDLLPTVAAPWFPTLEADMPLEYLPFAVAKLAFPAARGARVPSRITTYLEMALGSTNPAGRHVRPVVSGWQARVTKALAANVRRASSDLPPADLAATLESTLARAALTVYTCGGAKDAQAESLEPRRRALRLLPADTVVRRPAGRRPSRAALAALN
ncbi:FK506 binding protein [Aureococcus anophagefferens]|nr:FK506 binding protein [Aureococcus anophagefferens]